MPEINPFGADPALLAEEHVRVLREHRNDMTMPWPLERLRQLLKFPDGSEKRWQIVNVRLADLRAAFVELDHYKLALDEARELAESLYAFECRGADWPNVLDEFNPDLKHDLLPKWLSGEPDAPEEWQTPHANAEAEREAGMDATREHDPDLGKDLDYDDDERTTDADYEAYDGTDDEYEMDHDENGWPK